MKYVTVKIIYKRIEISSKKHKISHCSLQLNYNEKKENYIEIDKVPP